MPRDRKTYAKSFSVTDTTVRQLVEIAEKLDLLNDSDSMRRAVSEFHKSLFPDYIYKRSAKDMEKRQEVEKKIEAENLNPIEFAERNIPGCVVVGAEDGHEYIIIHGTANMLSAVRDDQIKAWYSDYSDLVQLHITKAATIPVVGELNPYMIKYLRKNYGISEAVLSELIPLPHVPEKE